MFKTIYLEENIKNHPRAKNILSKFQKTPVQVINKYDDYFGKFYKPYLQKRTSINLYIAQKKGLLVKKTPAAYGLDNGTHYYYMNAFNCIYECEYCYLQGYFKNPDICLFINYEDIGKEIRKIYENNQNGPIWFHAGEFSDSLALSSLTNELDYFIELFNDLPKAFLELRTKSININNILNKKIIHQNVLTTFSISPKNQIAQYDRKTPSLKLRLKALKKLQNNNYPIALHMDPLVPTAQFSEEFNIFIDEILDYVDPKKVQYISIGVPRFTSDVWNAFKKNYPASKILKLEMTKEQLIRPYFHIRTQLLNDCKNKLVSAGFDEKTIYLCME